MTDSLAGLTEEVSEDDYEEGEILDGDSLYDDVSSSEEFTESEIERKKSNENEETQGRKRKEHICKDGSLCRKERSGKHCYARIKHRRTSLESTEKPRNFDDKKVKERNISKTWKKHDILKDKDILKTFQSKERRRQERGYDRRQENKAKYRSPSPKIHHVHSAKPTKTSLLKRLVASGSVSARVPTETETDKEKDLDMNPIGEDHNEWNLRIEALKTALMKKFASKKKNCATLKTNTLNDSIFEYALNDLADHGNDNKPKDVDYRKPCLEIESFNESIFKERKTILFSDTDVDCRTFTCYPYVFDKILSPKEDVAVVPNGERPKSPEKIENSLKRKNSLNILDAKKPKFEAEDKDEEELRELALMSVKPKSKNEPLNPKDELLKPLHIDTQLPSEPEKMTSNNSGSDPWEDVDEDILRAQLLSSLSAKIHSEYVEPEPTPKKPVKKLVKIKKPVKKIIKTNPSILLKDKFVNKRFVKKNNQITGPTMKKLIIKVDDSDSSDVETPVKMKPDISASIDQLLKEVRSETEKLLKEKNPVIPNLNDPTNLSKNSSETTPKITANNKILNIDSEKMSSKSSSKSIATPQGIKHLPPWQQEEYRILKKKLFEKQKMWNLKAPMKSPVDENGKTENSNLQPKETSKPPILPKAEEVLKERSEQKQVQIESWHESKEVSEMLILLEKLEKELDEFRCVKDETARLRKEYSLMQNKMLKKKRLLILSKEALENKDDLLKSKYSEFLKKKTEEQKQSHRDSEMSTLRFKEISLRAQLVCINLEKELKIEKMSKKEKSTPSSPLKKPKIPPDVKSEEGSRENQKKVFSLADKDNLDPFMPLCPYDITGVCNDEECKYQHIRPL